MRWISHAIALAVALLAFGAASAPSETTRRDARRAYDAGVAAYNTGDFDAAARAFSDAYRLQPSPALLYDLAQSQRLAGHQDTALASYRAFLAASPNAKNRGQVEGHIAELMQALRDTAPPAAALAAAPADDRRTVADLVSDARKEPGAFSERLARALRALALPALRAGLAYTDNNTRLQWFVRAAVTNALNERAENGAFNYDARELDTFEQWLSAAPAAPALAAQDARELYVRALASTSPGRTRLFRLLSDGPALLALFIATHTPAHDTLTATIDRVLWTYFLAQHERPLSLWPDTAPYGYMSQHRDRFAARLRALIVQSVAERQRIAPIALDLYTTRDDAVFADIWQWAEHSAPSVSGPARSALFAGWYNAMPAERQAAALRMALLAVKADGHGQFAFWYLGVQAAKNADALLALRAALDSDDPSTAGNAVQAFTVEGKVWAARDLWRWLKAQPDARFTNVSWQPALENAALAIERFSGQGFGVREEQQRCAFAEGQQMQASFDRALLRGDPPAVAQGLPEGYTAQLGQRLLQARGAMTDKLRL